VELIDRSELPVAIKQIIQLVVQNSRLWRGEKREVANELLAHFEDGLRSGKDAAKLIHDFGDPQLIAQLIRSSKIRNRSMNTKLLSAGLWGFLLFVLFYFGLTAFYHSGKANPSHDYEADLNRPALAIAPVDAAWSIYRPAFTKFGFSEGGAGRFEEIYVQTDNRSDLVTPRDGEAWKRAIEKLEEGKELLDAFRAARMKSHLGLPLCSNRNQYSEVDFAALFPNQTRGPNSANDASSPSEFEKLASESMIGILLPHYQVMRYAAHLLVIDTRWAVEQNDFERVTQNVESIFGFSRQLGNEPLLIGDLIAYAIQSIGYDLIDEVLTKHLNRFSEAQLARIQSSVADSDPSGMIDLEGEKLLGLDVLQRCFTNDGNGDGRITADAYRLLNNWNSVMGNEQPVANGDSGYSKFAKAWEAVSAPLIAIQFPSRKQVEEEYLSLLDDGNQQLQKPYFAATSFESSNAKVAESSPFAKALFPAIQQVATAMFRTKGQQEATAAAIAIYRYQKEHGKLPGSLDALEGKYLDQLPGDQFDGDLVRYLKKSDGFILYSIGCDLVDNGGQRRLVSADGSDGKLPKDQPEPTGQFLMSGNDQGFDWVLWPRMSHKTN
jgi:hypothetical protein